MFSRFLYHHQSVLLRACKNTPNYSRTHPNPTTLSRSFNSNSNGGKDKLKLIIPYLQKFIMKVMDEARHSGMGQQYQSYLKGLVPLKNADKQLKMGQRILGASTLLGLATLAYYNYNRENIQSARKRYPLWQPYERTRVKSVLGYLTASTAITSFATWKSHVSPIYHKLSKAYGWKFFGGVLAVQLISGIVILNTKYNHKRRINLKDLMFIVHNAFFGLSIAQLWFVKGRSVMIAFMANGIAVSGLTCLAFFAPERIFIRWHVPLTIAFGAIFVTSLGASIFPPITWLAITLFSTNLYGGILLFCGMILRDTQRIIKNAELLPIEMDGSDTFDPINAALSVHMDQLNVFVRSLQLAGFKELKRMKP